MAESTIRLRKVGLHDWQFLYDLLAERPHEANISHREMPDISQHIAFLRSDPYTAWYIIELKNREVGAIYLSKQDEIGIAVLREHQGKGIARQAIEELMRQHPKPRYLANIAPGNIKSQQMFMEMGFNHIQNTYELRA